MNVDEVKKVMDSRTDVKASIFAKVTLSNVGEFLCEVVDVAYDRRGLIMLKDILLVSQIYEGSTVIWGEQDVVDFDDIDRIELLDVRVYLLYRENVINSNKQKEIMRSDCNENIE